MPLQSQLFSGDPQLEACLIRDSAHVVQGAVGDHVAKIQIALSAIDGLIVGSVESAAKRYGSSTANAVLTFKKKRNIINRTYQTQADDIVGKMTIAALDREMLERESQRCPLNTCQMNTRGGEITHAGSPAETRRGEAPPVGQSVGQQVLAPKDAALQAIPLAQFWVALGAVPEVSVLSALSFAHDLKANPKLPFPPVFDVVNTHFHLDREPARLTRNLQRLRDVYGLIQTVLGNGVKFFQTGPVTAKSPFADAPVGGFQFPNTPFHKITFRPGYLTCGPNTRAAMIVHECAHFVGGLNVIDHFAMEFPVPNGQPQGKGHTRNYRDLLTREALRNASSYAAFAIHAATGQDSRFGAQNIAL